MWAIFLSRRCLLLFIRCLLYAVLLWQRRWGGGLRAKICPQSLQLLVQRRSIIQWMCKSYERITKPSPLRVSFFKLQANNGRQISVRQVKLIAVGVENGRKKVCKIFCCREFAACWSIKKNRFKYFFNIFFSAAFFKQLFPLFYSSANVSPAERFKEFFCLPLNYCELHQVGISSTILSHCSHAILKFFTKIKTSRKSPKWISQISKLWEEMQAITIQHIYLKLFCEDFY